MSLLRTYVRSMITEGEDIDPYLYHVTTSGRLSSVASSGLGGGASQFTNYSDYSQGRTFLTERDGVSYWADRVWAHSQHGMEDTRWGIPIVLRVVAPPDEELEIDERGSQDCGCDSYMTGHVDAGNVEVWTGKSFVSIGEWSGAEEIEEILDGLEALYTVDEEEEEDGETIYYVDYEVPGF